MTTITLPRATVEQALEVLDSVEGKLWRPWSTDAARAADALRAALAQPLRPPVTKGRPRKLPEDNDHGDWDRINALEASLREHMAEIHRLRAALAQQAEPTVKDSLQVPAEIAATITTTDIAWLATCRLTKLWQELGQMRWAGADEGWDRAIEAVRSRLNDECQAVLDWKAKVDQSNATAIELLQKMQGVKDD